MKMWLAGAVALALSLGAGWAARAADGPKDVKLVNVSYDPTRELYEEINKQFTEGYKAKTGVTVTIEQSHGGSGKQARAVIDGLKADVVTLALGWDVTAIERAGLIKEHWQHRLPENAAPYTSTIVFLVRKGNPKQVKDWPDLVRAGVAPILSNPKTSGGARWAFLAAWGAAAKAKTYDFSSPGAAEEARNGAKAAGTFAAYDDKAARDYITALYKQVPVLDTGARGSTVTFAQKGLGDVLVSWENEAWLAQEEFGKEKFDIIYPSTSILAEPPVAVVDQVVDAKGTREAAEAYLKYLYTPEAQQTIAELHYRPRDRALLKQYASTLPPIKLFTIDETFGGWEKAQRTFFAEGGVFDQLYTGK